MIKKLAMIIVASVLLAATVQAGSGPFRFGMMGPPEGRGDGPFLGRDMTVGVEVQDPEWLDYPDWMYVAASKSDVGADVSVYFQFKVHVPPTEEEGFWFWTGSSCRADISPDRIDIDREAKSGSFSIDMDELTCETWWEGPLLPPWADGVTTIKARCQADGSFNRRGVTNEVVKGEDTEEKYMYSWVSNSADGIVYLDDKEFVNTSDYSNGSIYVTMKGPKNPY